MKNFDHDEKQIIEKLNQLPLIEDSLDKDELYQRVSRQVHTTEPKRQPLKKLVPIVSTVFVVALLFIIIPSLFSTNNMESLNDLMEKETYDIASEDSSVTQEDTKNAEIALDQKETSQNDDISGNEETIENVEDSETQDGDRYVIQSIDENESIVFGAVTDNQAQYVIPLTMVVPSDQVLDDSYNELSSHLNEDELGVSPYLFDDVQFEIDQDNKRVIMNVPETFTLGDGGAIHGLLENILSQMFSPYSIEKVIFQTSAGQGVDLGPFGFIEEMKLPHILANYKLYRVPDEMRTFLIPIPQEEESTIEEALNDLKTSNEVFNVHQTIPENVQFIVEPSDNVLTVNFTDNVSSIEQDGAIIMIESILMTAKSYGYEFVSFNNLPDEQFGPYQLHAPIKVPVGVNPINQ